MPARITVLRNTITGLVSSDTCMSYAQWLLMVQAVPAAPSHLPCPMSVGMLNERLYCRRDLDVRRRH